MGKNQLDFDKALNKILNDTKYFLEQIGDNEGNTYKDTLLPKIDGKKRDYLNTTLNPLASAIDVLETKVLTRSTEQLKILTEEAIKNLNQIMEEIRLNDNKYINKNYLFFEKQTVAVAYDFLSSGKTKLISKTKMVDLEEIRIHDSKPINKSDLVIDTHKIFKYNKTDVLLLTYYSLIELYEEYGYYRKDFKSKALNKIKNKFHKDLAGNTLKISLLSIKSDTSVLSPRNIPSTRFSYPTYGVTI